MYLAAATLLALMFYLGPGGWYRDIAFALAGLAAVGLALAMRSAHKRAAAHAAEGEAQQKELDSQREWFRVTFASIGDGVLTTDEGGNVSFLNAVAETLTGWRQGEAQGQRLEDVFRIVNEQTRLPVENPVYQALREGVVVGLANHTLLIAKDGLERAIDDSAAPIRSGEGRIIGVVLVFRDITERRKQEIDRSRLAALVRSSDDAIYSKTPGGILTSWNQSAERLYHYTAEEIIGQPVSVLVPEDRSAELSDIMRRVHRGELTDHFETVRRRKDGSLVNVLVSVSPIRDEAGTIIGASSIARDITERKRTAVELQRLNRDLERRVDEFQTLLDVIPIGIAVADSPGCDHIWRNPSLNRMLQLEPGAGSGRLIGQPGGCEFYREGRELAPDELPIEVAARTGEEVRDVDLELRCPDGSVVRALGYGAPLFDETGAVRGSIAAFADVTDRLKAENTIRSLLRISARLNSTLDVDELLEYLVLDAIHLVGAESGVSGLLTAQGMTARRYFRKGETLPLEYCWAPMHGLPGWLIVHRAPYLTNNAARDPQSVPELDARFGVRSALSTPILNAEGELLGFFEIHNKTEGGFTAWDRERLIAVSQAAAVAIQNAIAYRKLQRAEETLREADRRKDEFLATLSHELRNPLAPLSNAVQVLRLAGDDPGTRESARRIMERQLEQLVRLVDDLLDLSRVTRGKMELRKERIDLIAAVNSAIETSRPLVEARDHTLAVSLPPGPVYLEADLIRLAQVFANLLSNACKYTERGGRIRLLVERDGNDAVVKVGDNGIGIPAHALPWIFDIFTQFDQSFERSQGGLGIGLSLVRRLVEMHGGTVEAHSDGPGQGSEFVVRLPLCVEQPAGLVTEEADGRIPAPRRRILVVEDNLDSAETLREVLALLGHEVLTAYDGLEAVTSAETFRPDLVLLDIGLPKLNGYDAARRIRKQPWGKGMVLVATTGWGQEDDRKRARDAGFDIHLTKPVRIESVQALLARMDGTRTQFQDTR